MLPAIYNQHIADKLDITTLHCVTPCQLNKLILTAASTAYATLLKQQTMVTMTNNDFTKQYKKPCVRRRIQKSALPLMKLLSCC